MNVARASYTTANWLLGAQIVLRLWANKSQRGLKGARNAPSQFLEQVTTIIRFDTRQAVT